MKRLIVPVSIMLLFLSAYTVSAAAPSASETLLVQLEQRAAKAETSTAGEYAKNLLDAARSSIAGAKISLAAGKDKLAALQIELAGQQLSAADARAAERELLERVAVKRSELKKVEARLERFRQGEEN